jgi:hypothetical protein
MLITSIKLGKIYVTCTQARLGRGYVWGVSMRSFSHMKTGGRDRSQSCMDQFN